MRDALPACAGQWGALASPVPPRIADAVGWIVWPEAAAVAAASRLSWHAVRSIERTVVGARHANAFW